MMMYVELEREGSCGVIITHRPGVVLHSESFPKEMTGWDVTDNLWKLTYKYGVTEVVLDMSPDLRQYIKHFWERNDSNPPRFLMISKM